MTDIEKMNSIDWLLAICVGVLLCGILAAPNFPTLNDSAYTSLLHITQNQPVGSAEAVMRGLYGSFGNIFGSAGALGQINFFKNLPLYLGFFSSIMAYGALRFLKFDRLESMLAAILAMMSPSVALAFFPGLIVVQMLAIPLTLSGILGLSMVASGKHVGAIGLLLALLGFSAAIWVYPAASLLLAALLIGNLLEAREHLPDLSKLDDAARMRLVALVLPFAMLIITPLPTLTISFGDIQNLLQNGWMLAGLAFMSFVAWRRPKHHPQALLYAVLTVAGILMAGISPSLAMLAWMMPAAYGLHTLKQWEDDPLAMRAAMVAVLVWVSLFGLMVGAEGWEQAAGSALLVAAGVVAMVHLWGWSSALVRSGAAVFLLAAVLMTSAGAMTALASGSSMIYTYSPLDNDTQAALLWISNQSNLSGSPVAALATPQAVQFLSHDKPAATNDETGFLRWLAAPSNSSSNLTPGSLVVVPLTAFDIMNSHEAQIGRNWTLISFQYTGKTNDTSPLAVFDSPQNGLRVMHPLDANGGLAAERVYLYAMPGQSYLRTLPIGSVQLLHSNQSINADGNRLIWPNDELNSRVLALFEDKPAGFSIVYDTPKVRVLRVIG